MLECEMKLLLVPTAAQRSVKVYLLVTWLLRRLLVNYLPNANFVVMNIQETYLKNMKKNFVKKGMFLMFVFVNLEL